MKTPISKIFSGSLLVAGTAIGAGMLALPVATAEGGFFPALVTYLLCWFFMTATGLFMLEVCLWMPKDVNLVSMSSHLLGQKGKMVSWVLYLFLFYCLTIAYMAGGGSFIKVAAQGLISSKVSIALFTLAFAPIVYLGTRAVDRVNMILMVGLIVSYIGFVILGYKHVEFSLLTRYNIGASIFALPIVFTSFSYQGIIPSLMSYMDHHARAVRLSIIIGTLSALVIYVVWEVLILGVIPLEGPMGLLSAKESGQDAIFSLKAFVKSPWVSAIGQSFAFFALTTSFLGVTLGLVDFLADGLKIAKKGLKKLALCFAVFFPSIVVAMSNPKIFLSALRYAGGIGCALLLGLIPILMVYRGRYKMGLGLRHKQIWGGKKFLIILAVFVCIEVLIECISEMTS